MSYIDVTDPFKWLLELESKAKQKPVLLPGNRFTIGFNTGICFKIADGLYVAKIEILTEVIPFGNIVPLPGVKKWLLGLINIRGNLLPIIDLGLFLYGINIKPHDKERILIVKNKEMCCGFCVQQTIGLQEIDDGGMQNIPGSNQESEFIDKKVNIDKNAYYYLDFTRIIKSRKFLNFINSDWKLK